ncbi:hypothetical protein S7S_03245 [Isoalcanivorax pacificus W11-5]|uniref:Uncharacterized protein n=1 Tax=Isoalcanivorax pacificus W11-5 TaxID=391936 RepID=A0A0B4XJ50_9GAMM|nr:hypothetical protein S7S_03245 [Isoalcanivorax pacificus W11-5]
MRRIIQFTDRVMALEVIIIELTKLVQVVDYTTVLDRDIPRATRFRCVIAIRITDKHAGARIPFFIGVINPALLGIILTRPDVFLRRSHYPAITRGVTVIQIAKNTEADIFRVCLYQPLRLPSIVVFDTIGLYTHVGITYLDSDR